MEHRSPGEPPQDPLLTCPSAEQQPDIVIAREQLDIRPTMVFVDGDHRYEGIKKDLDTLSAFLEPGVPVLCHGETLVLT